MHNSKGNGKAAREKPQFLTAGHCDVTGGHQLAPPYSILSHTGFFFAGGWKHSAKCTVFCRYKDLTDEKTPPLVLFQRERLLKPSRGREHWYKLTVFHAIWQGKIERPVCWCLLYSSFFKGKHFSAALRSRNYSLAGLWFWETLHLDFYCQTVRWSGYLRAGSRRWSRQSPPGWGWWEGWPAGWCWSWRSPGTSWPHWARSCGSPASGRPGRKTARCAAWAARTGGRGELSELAFNLRFQFHAWLHMFRHINNTIKRNANTP